jgi:hypothetical protein
MGAVLSSFALAQAPQEQDPELMLLADATIFKMGLVGINAHISDEESALQKVVHSQRAHSRLVSLLQSAKENEGKMYALCGMNQLSPTLYRKHVLATQWNGDSLNLMEADIITKVSATDYIQHRLKTRCTEAN